MNLLLVKLKNNISNEICFQVGEGKVKFRCFEAVIILAGSYFRGQKFLNGSLCDENSKNASTTFKSAIFQSR
mgnify:CR=1 FL=1